MANNPKNNKTSGIVRLVVLLILLGNQALVTFGYNPLPFSEEQIFEGVSTAATAVAAVWAWWKHSNITKEAQEAQEVLERKKARSGATSYK